MKYIFILLFCFYWEANAQLQINEVCSDNEELLQSDDGNYYDWIEIYNNTDSQIELSDFYLSDNKDDLHKWQFSTEKIGAKSYILVFASNSKTPVPNEQHANFKLSGDGETIYLSDGNSIIDTLEFGQINEDYTYGRLEENSEIKAYLAKPTPRESNGNSGTIVSNYESGYYTDEFDLKLTAAKGKKIYYTTNGDTPTEKSNLYTDGIEVEDEYEDYEYIDIPTTPSEKYNCAGSWKLPKENIPRCFIVSYRIIDNSGNWGKTYSQTFFFNNLHKLPIVSIVTDNQNLFNQDTGIYVPGSHFDPDNPCWSGNYFFSEWERNASVSIFDNKLEIFKEDVGIRIQGGGTRATAQKSLKFYARKRYGINKFKNVFFKDLEVKEFNNILLRSTVSGWFQTKIKDAVTMEAVKKLKFEQTYLQPVVVYINGNYWGINELRNRIDNDFLAEKYDINKDSINIIHPVYTELLRAGTYEDFKPIYKYIVENDLSVAEHYKYIESKIDITDIIDYYIAEIYFNNYDWPLNNILFWNSLEYDGKYRSIFYDLDAGWGDANYNMIEHVTQDSLSSWPNSKEINIILIKLLKNTEFKNNFINRAIYLAENDFSFKNLQKIIEKYTKLFETEIDNSINRFQFLDNKEDWYYRIKTNLTDFAEERECKFKQHLIDYFHLDPILLCSPTDVNPANESKLVLSPNPATNKIKITGIDSKFISIYNLQGLLLLDMPTLGKSTLEIDVSKLSPSIYLLKTDKKTLKFIRIN